MFYSPLRELLLLSLSYDAVYSHIVLIPIVSVYFFIADRRVIFQDVQYNFKGIFVVLAGLLMFAGSYMFKDVLNRSDMLSLTILSALIIWIGGFIFFFGGKAFSMARFPLLFLVFMIPIPSFILDEIIFLLQKFSSETANILFMISGVPYHHTGFTFHLSDLSVEVAEQCSGIRSSLALFIGSIIAGHMFLKSGWMKAALALIVFPISIVRNGARVVMLALLGNYVDPAILSGNIHKKGGIPLFIISFAFLMILLWVMRRSERVSVTPEK